MRAPLLCLAAAICAVLVSCNRIKNRFHTAGQVAISVKDAAVDKVIPTFDSYHPDTRPNRKRFEAFFGFAPTPDVTDLYCYSDRMGIDSKFLFAFRCAPATVSRIVTRLRLAPSAGPDNSSSGFWQHMPWWDSASIVMLTPYSRQAESQYYKYLWYDTAARKAYYIDFDL